MKQVITILILVIVLAGGGWAVYKSQERRFDTRVTKFNEDANNVIQGLQQYKEFVGTYPAGSGNADVVKALLGQGEKKVLILAIRKSDLSAKGEIIDPWGTPMMIYFSGNAVIVRSAGPNKAWEDTSIAASDDLFRSN